MSIEALTIVLNHSRAKGAAKVVLMGIANHINPDNDGAWPSQARLAAYANISDRAVRDAIAQLVELGELRFEVAAGQSKSQYKPNRYWLTITCPDDCDRSTGHNRAELFVKQGGTFQQSGWKQASDKPYIEPEIEPEVKTFVQTKVERKSYDNEFEKFWAVYPRKSGKLEAERVFLKTIASIDLDTLIDGAIRYRDDPNRIERFTSEAAKWLRGGRWDDPPLPPDPRKQKQAEKDEAARRLAEWEANERRKLNEQD